jgi:hypothetical protein
VVRRAPEPVWTMWRKEKSVAPSGMDYAPSGFLHEKRENHIPDEERVFLALNDK